MGQGGTTSTSTTANKKLVHQSGSSSAISQLKMLLMVYMAILFFFPFSFFLVVPRVMLLLDSICHVAIQMSSTIAGLVTILALPETPGLLHLWYPSPRNLYRLPTSKRSSNYL